MFNKRVHLLVKESWCYQNARHNNKKKRIYSHL